MNTPSFRFGFLLSALFSLLIPHETFAQALAPGGAEVTQEAEQEFDWSLSGRLRYRHSMLSDFPTSRLNEDDHGLNEKGSLLLRWAPSLQFGEWLTAKVTLDLWDGQVAGDESAVAADALLIPNEVPGEYTFNRLLREAYVDAFMGIGRLRAGRMASQWGMGLLANGGDREPEAFADASHGDISNRVLFITRPLGMVDGTLGESLFLMVGGDLVERDELTSRVDGDTALQGVAALLWKTENFEMGTYAAYRNLESAEGYTTSVLANDFYGKWTQQWNNRGTLQVESEWVLLQGETEELRFIGAPYPIDIFQFGGAANIRWDPLKDGVLGSLGLGWAPGDNAPKDGTARGIRFDPGFKAGMILFEDVLGKLSAQSHDNASDPALLAVPSQGIERVPTNGSVHNAIYLFPQVGYTFLDQRFETRLGALVAFSSGDVVDPFSSALFGGYNRNAFDQVNANGLLGTELLAGISFKQDGLWENLGFRMGLEYGTFLPGEALQDENGEDPIGTLHKGRILTDLYW